MDSVKTGESSNLVNLVNWDTLDLTWRTAVSRSVFVQRYICSISNRRFTSFRTARVE